MSDIGPVQVLAVSFGPEATFEGAVLEELERLEAAGTVRVLDLLFVRKDPDSGDLLALDVQGESLGAIVGELLGFESEPDPERPQAVVRTGAEALGMSRDDLDSMAASIEPGAAAGVMLIEHVWARDLKRALRDAGGVPIAEGFLTPEAIATVAADLVAVARAIDEETASTAA
jgi:hypothetical protein